MRSTLSIMCRALAGLLVLLPAGCLPKTTPEAIWIGHVAPLSGPLRASGEEARRAIELAVEEANHDGQRIHGRRVAVVHADDRGDPEAAQAEAVRLVTINRASALLGGISTAEAERLARANQSYSLPVVALAAVPAPHPSEGVLSLAVGPAYQGRILARFAAEQLKPERVAVVADGRSSAATDLSAGFAREFSKQRIEELAYQGDGDFPDLVRRLDKLQPGVILIAAPARDFLKLSALLKEAKVSGALLYGGSEGEQPLLRADRDASQGVHLAATYLADNDTPSNQEFVKKYQDRYQQELPGAPAAQAYDGVRLLVEAMRRTRTLDPAELRRELTRTERFDSLTGPITFTKEAHAMRNLYIVRLDDGQLALVRKYEPEGK